MTEHRIQLPEPDADDKGPYTHLGFCKAKAGHEARVETLILALLEHIRREPGNLAFHAFRDRADAGTFVVYEMFRSIADLRSHLAQPYTRSFIEEIGPHVEGPLRQQFLRMSSRLPEANVGA